MTENHMGRPDLSSLSILGPSAFYRLAFTDWPRPTDPTALSSPLPDVVCVHGLTRNGRDFDPLAMALQKNGHRVVCPDMPGRGLSDLLANAEDYAMATYLAACSHLLVHLRDQNPNVAVNWVGTSMGGLIGMVLAATPGSPIRKLVINDIGPFVPKTALMRIADYVAHQPVFDTLDEAETFIRNRHAPFGPLSDAYWQHMTRHSVQRNEDGAFALCYDPKIAEAFAVLGETDLDLWSIWDQIRCPVLVMRGESSDVLPANVADAMTKRGPKAIVRTWPETGHAPALENVEQISEIEKFLTV